MRPSTLVSLTISTLLFGLPAASARPPGGDGPGRSGQRLERMLNDLNLSAEQQAQVRRLAADRKSKARPLRKRMKQKRQELRALWRAERLDRGAILALTDEITAMRRSLQVARIDFRIGLHRALSPAQRDELRQRRSQRRMRRRGARGRRGMHRGRRAERGFEGEGDFEREDEL